MKKKPPEQSEPKYIFKSLGVFFLILPALMLIPVMASVVVILIKGIMDIRYVIIIGGGLLLAVFVIWLIRWAIVMARRFRKNSGEMQAHVEKHMDYSDAAEISVLGGLFKIRYGGKKRNSSLPEPNGNPGRFLQLAHTTGDGSIDVVAQLQTLTKLKNAGEIDYEEYRILKHQLIHRDAIVGQGPAGDPAPHFDL
jgi:hypothetical protein